MTKIAEDGNTSTYIHVFTNASEVSTFVNRSGEDIAVRCLVVGAGGAGGYGLNTSSGGAGGLGGDTGGIKGNARYGSSGADGIVVIRYDWTYDPNPPLPGMVLLVK